jgi:hypothetical protein
MKIRSLIKEEFINPELRFVLFTLYLTGASKYLAISNSLLQSLDKSALDGVLSRGIFTSQLQHRYVYSRPRGKNLQNGRYLCLQMKTSTAVIF